MKDTYYIAYACFTFIFIEEAHYHISPREGEVIRPFMTEIENAKAFVTTDAGRHDVLVNIVTVTTTLLCTI